MAVEKTANEWKLEGNSHVKAQRWEEAIVSYNLGLEIASKETDLRLLLLNRCYAALRSERYDLCLEDAEVILSAYPADEKALYRGSKAHYGLRNYDASYAFLSILLIDHPDNKVAQEELKRVKLRMQEQEFGCYDFTQMLDEVTESTPHLDRASFTGPVEVRKTEASGRGLFVTRNVRAGGLLLCEKAFALVYGFLDANNGHGEIVLDADQSKLLCRYFSDIQHKLSCNPSLLDSFANLYHGSYSPQDEGDEDSAVEISLIERVVSLNAFSAPLSSHYSHLQAKHVSDEDVILPSLSMGLWLMASMINHGCLKNVERSFIGDVIIVRAARDLYAGEELKIAYMSPFETLAHRDEGCKHYGFICTCSLCGCQRATSNKLKKKRARLPKDLRALFENHGPLKVPLEKVEEIIATANLAYKRTPSEEPRLQLMEPLYFLASQFRILMYPSGVVKTVLNLLEVLGFEMDVSLASFSVRRWGFLTDTVVQALALLWNACGQMHPKWAGGVEDVLKTAYEIIVGERETFHGVYGKDEPGGEGDGRVTEV